MKIWQMRVLKLEKFAWKCYRRRFIHSHQLSSPPSWKLGNVNMIIGT